MILTLNGKTIDFTDNMQSIYDLEYKRQPSERLLGINDFRGVELVINNITTASINGGHFVLRSLCGATLMILLDFDNPFCRDIKDAVRSCQHSNITNHYHTHQTINETKYEPTIHEPLADL